MMSCPKRNQRVKKYEETPFGSGCLKITNCISTPILGHIYCAFTQKQQSYCLKRCMKGFVGVTQEEDLCRTEPLPRDIGDRGCRRKPWNMLKSVTSPKVCPKYSSAKRGPQAFVQSMAVCPMGPGYCRTFPKGSRK